MGHGNRKRKEKTRPTGKNKHYKHRKATLRLRRFLFRLCHLLLLSKPSPKRKKGISVLASSPTELKRNENRPVQMGERMEEGRKVNKKTHCRAAKTIWAFRSFKLASRFSVVSSQIALPPTCSSLIDSAFRTRSSS